MMKHQAWDASPASKLPGSSCLKWVFWFSFLALTFLHHPSDFPSLAAPVGLPRHDASIAWRIVTGIIVGVVDFLAVTPMNPTSFHRYRPCLVTSCAVLDLPWLAMKIPIFLLIIPRPSHFKLPDSSFRPSCDWPRCSDVWRRLLLFQRPCGLKSRPYWPLPPCRQPSLDHGQAVHGYFPYIP